MKQLLALAALLMLTACPGPVNVHASLQDTPTLGISAPPPLQMKDFAWKTCTVNKVPYLALDAYNYSLLAGDMDKLQNLVHEDTGIINDYQLYEKGNTHK